MRELIGKWTAHAAFIGFVGRLWLLALPAIIFAGCPPPPPAAPPATPQNGAQNGTQGPETGAQIGAQAVSIEGVMLVGIRHDPTGGRMRVVPVRLHDAGVEVAADAAVSITGYSRFNPPVTVDAGTVFVADYQEKVLTRWTPFVPDAKPQSIPMPEHPASVLADGSRVLVGIRGGMLMVDFGVVPPRVTTLHQSAQRRFQKPVDFIVALPRMLVGIDDVVIPKFAFVFDLDAEKTPTFSRVVDMPAGVNAHYTAAVPYRTEHMVLAESFGHRGGFGANLQVAHVTARGISLEGAQESEMRGGGDSFRGFAGETFTEWTGLGVIGDTAIIGAGSRGVLFKTLPGIEPDFSGMHAVDGPVISLVTIGPRIFALVDADTTDDVPGDLVELRFEAESRTFSTVARHRLPVPLDLLRR